MGWDDKGQRALLLVLLGALAISCSALGQSREIDEHDLPRPDGSQIHYYLVKPKEGSPGPFPMVVIMHGSDCNSVVNNPRLHEYLNLAPSSVIVLVEKYGIDRAKEYELPGEETSCPREYLEHNTISQRVLDNVQVIVELQRTAEWWGGQIVLWGGSEGAMVASYAALLVPSTTALMVSSFGGGRPVFEIVKMSIAKSESFPSEEAKLAVLQDVEKQFEIMIREPVPTKTMGGLGNTYKWWADAMNLDGRIILSQLEIPVLIVQGETDEQAPVEAARDLARAMGGSQFRYKEFAGLDHLYQDSEGVSHRVKVIEYQRRWLDKRLDSD